MGNKIGCDPKEESISSALGPNADLPPVRVFRAPEFTGARGLDQRLRSKGERGKRGGRTKRRRRGGRTKRRYRGGRVKRRCRGGKKKTRRSGGRRR